MKLPGCDLIPIVSNYCLREWQEIWSNCVNNKLYAIYHTVGSVVDNKRFSRHESVISTDFKLVILVSPTLTYYRVTINQLVALVDIHLQFGIYCWTVSICRMPGEDTSLLPVSEICLKLLTIMLLLILSKTYVFIVYLSTSFLAFNSVYHKTVVLCTHLLIKKTFLFIYLFT